jgi:hypothetical protein
MSGTNLEIGNRLKEVRSIFNEGGKLSAEQFAYLLEETGDRIRNYELGRAGIPVRLLYNLYYRGINPIYIITGEGSVFAPNKEGEELENKIVSKTMVQNNMKLVKENKDSIIKVAAGKL